MRSICVTCNKLLMITVYQLMNEGVNFPSRLLFPIYSILALPGILEQYSLSRATPFQPELPPTPPPSFPMSQNSHFR